MKQLSVIQTDIWLEKAYHAPHRIFKKLTSYFQDAEEYEVSQMLTMHGMYVKPKSDADTLVKALRKKKVWDMIKQEESELKKQWNGRNIPIFIFPSNTYNRKIRDHYNGRAGLSFHDKLFLFVSEENTAEEMKALFTHEYNHCCRLSHDPRSEKDYRLLDVILLEGLAEHAVKERYGEKYQAPWTTYYNQDQLRHMWEKLIKPKIDLPLSSQKVHDLLYGKKLYPEMVGYCVGYYLVNRYAQKTGKKSKDLLALPSEKIALI